MNDDFLVCWLDEEYIPGGNDGEDDVWVYTTTFAIMSGDKNLLLDEICSVEGYFIPTDMSPGHYGDNNYAFAAVGTDTAVIAIESEYDPDRQYETRGIAILNKSEKSFNVIIEDIVLSSLLLVGIDATGKRRNEIGLFAGKNNSFFENGEMHAWFGIEVGYYPDEAVYYFSINSETGVLSVITDVGSAGLDRIQFMTNNLISYRPPLNGGRYDYLYSRGGGADPVPILSGGWETLSVVDAISADETQVFGSWYHSEIYESLHSLFNIVGGVSSSEVLYFPQGAEYGEILFVDFDAEVVAFYDYEYSYDGYQFLGIRIVFYNFQGHIVFNHVIPVQEGDGGYSYEVPNYQGLKASAVFIAEVESRDVVHPIYGPLPFQVPVSAVMFPDGSTAIIEDKHPWLMDVNRSPMQCVCMWSGGGSAQPKNFWTAFQYTQETI